VFWDAQIGSKPAIAIHVRHGNGENIGHRAAYWLGPLALGRQMIRNARNDVHRAGISGRFSDNMPDSLVGSPGQAGAERRFCRQIAEEFRSLSTQSGLTSATPFVFCDSSHIIEMLRQYLPTLVACPKHFLEKGAGPLHQFRRGQQIAEEITRDMFVELELMRRCEGLVYMDSGFSIMTRTKLDGTRIRRLKPGLVNRSILKLISRMRMS
jgi:Nodulation protein Z (NodZ)